ncbi:YebC/PmpR family DNA-binding transcriptional regulator [Candidatus Saccharibacteria bacterium]|nr:MAG: YebC/PmpR family DNA-binding transcriptional regulator [Candidatus Saccharibacteria bacterium]
MSGHSKWATTHRQKAIVDAKRGAVFTKIGNMIAIAARGGTDPVINSSLALAIEKAKAANMPAANIQRAIDRVADKNAAQLEEATYEAYGPGGVAFIIETATDNKNRTYPEVRTAITKNGGTMADAGSVMFQFTRKGVIRLNTTDEEVLLAALDAGAEDVQEETGGLTVYTDMKDLAKVRNTLAAAGCAIEDAELQYVPNASVPVDNPETARKVMKVMDALDEVDDVVNVHTNADITVEVSD